MRAQQRASDSKGSLPQISCWRSGQTISGTVCAHGILKSAECSGTIAACRAFAQRTSRQLDFRRNHRRCGIRLRAPMAAAQSRTHHNDELPRLTSIARQTQHHLQSIPKRQSGHGEWHTGHQSRAYASRLRTNAGLSVRPTDFRLRRSSRRQ